MKAILRTSCGCERVFEWDERGYVWNVPKLPRVSVMNAVVTDARLSTRDDSLPIRRFRLHGRHAGMPLFLEEEEGHAIPPATERLIPLTTGEWADAVARWYRITGHGADGEPVEPGSIAEADLDFLRRHDGAEVIMHKSGALIGTFYMAPSWDNSNAAVSIFASIRQLGE